MDSHTPKTRNVFDLEELKKGRYRMIKIHRNQVVVNNRMHNMRKKHYLPPKIP